MIGISKRLLILCEDKKSSLTYLDSFKKDEKLKRDLSAVSVEIYQPKDFSPIGLVKEAKRKKVKAKQERNPFHEIWVVFDKDGHANIPQAVNMANDNGVKVAMSIACFEYWILLHFEKTTKAFSKCDDILSYIKKHHYPDYEKKVNCYILLKDKTHVAIQNGEWLEKQLQSDIDRGKHFYNLGAYTNLHQLVKKLFKPKDFLFK